MLTPAFSLRYVQTAENMRADFQRMRREWGRSWFRIAAALLMALMAISFATSGHGWSTAVLPTVAAIYLSISPSPLIWLLYFWALRRYSDLEMSIEVDESSNVSRREDQKYGYRQYWSRLSRIEETERGFELAFDGNSYPTMQILDKAFVDDAQRYQFREFVRQHAPVAVEWHRLSDEV